MKVIIILVVISVLASAAKYHPSQYKGYNPYFGKPDRRYTSKARNFPGYLTRFIGTQPRHSRPGGQSNEPIFRTADQCVDAASIDMESFDPPIPTKIYKMKIKIMATFRDHISNKTGALCVIKHWSYGFWYVTVFCDPGDMDEFELSVEEADITENDGCAFLKAKIAIGRGHPAEGCYLHRTPAFGGAQSSTWIGLTCPPYDSGLREGRWESQHLDVLYLTPTQTVDEQSPDAGVTTMYRFCAWGTKQSCELDIGLVTFTFMNPVDDRYPYDHQATIMHAIRIDV